MATEVIQFPHNRCIGGLEKILDQGFISEEDRAELESRV